MIRHLKRTVYCVEFKTKEGEGSLFFKSRRAMKLFQAVVAVNLHNGHYSSWCSIRHLNENDTKVMLRYSLIMDYQDVACKKGKISFRDLKKYNVHLLSVRDILSPSQP